MNSHPPSDEPTQAETERYLDRSFDQLRAAMSRRSAPSELETSLLAEFAAHQCRTAGTGGIFARWAALLAPGAALAASAGLAAWIWLVPLTVTQAPQAQLAAVTATETPFIALQSLEQIALEPNPRLVQSTLPRMALASYGVAVNPEIAGEMMRAELLVSANGQPLAMRFLP